jgi:1-aminocyclopropane-1-carboxylate deaminase/D-cysteine desulfhydrase-like pyridoxal-dependent ACC family enzyme
MRGDWMMKLDERYKIKGIQVTVRREDKRYAPPLPPHGKMGMLEMMIVNAKEEGYKLIGCFGSKYSNWVAGTPILSHKHGLKSVVCYPANRMSDTPYWIQHVEDAPYDGELWLLHPNMTSINGAQAKKFVEDQEGYFIPFGFDAPHAVTYLQHQFNDIPDRIGTMIVSTGSGITLAAILRSISLCGKYVKRIVAVSSGRPISSIKQTIKKHIELPSGITWVDRYKYADVPDIECPWNAHDHFELKAYDWMYRNIKRLPTPIYFVNIGGNS